MAEIDPNVYSLRGNESRGIYCDISLEGIQRVIGIVWKRLVSLGGHGDVTSCMGTLGKCHSQVVAIKCLDVYILQQFWRCSRTRPKWDVWPDASVRDQIVYSAHRTHVGPITSA